MASYVLYGFDTAGTLAEETGQPRRRAPRAILQALAAAATVGALLIVSAILAVSDPARPELGQIAGGLPMIVKDVLGPGLGTLFLIDVVFAVFVCALAVHAGTVRLIFAMARDNNLPFARALGRVPRRTQCPDAARAPGRCPRRGAPGRQHQPAACHRDPLLGRDRLGEPGVPARDGAACWSRGCDGDGARSGSTRPAAAAVLDGPARPAGQRDRVALGRLPGREHLLAAPGGLRAGPLGPVRGPAGDPGPARAGGLYYAIVQRRRTGDPGGAPAGAPRRRLAPSPAELPLDGQWIGRLAANE